ncbi:MAG: polysaccharide pyruvyl transferase family protein [Bacteroidales bacterium]|nr:polysaccharide pyruvyl transferase family protein [Bacteroidales bacterium]
MKLNRTDKIKILIPFSTMLNTGDAGIMISTLNSIKRSYGEGAFVLIGSHQVAKATEYYPEINYMEYKPNLNDRIFRRGLTKIPRNYLILLVRNVFGILPNFLLTGYEKQLIQNIKSSDLVISPGGGYLTDAYHLQFNLALFSWIIQSAKKPLVFYAQSIGPIWRKQTIRHLRFILHNARAIILRDFESVDHVKKIFGTLPENFSVSVDEAFTFKSLPTTKQLNKNHLGISVRDWNFSNTGHPHQKTMQLFKNNMKQLCEDLIKKYNCKITFLSTCQGNAEYKDDSVVAMDIVSQIDPAFTMNINVDRNFYSLDALIQKFANFDVFIGTRMHSIIFNFLNLTPCLGIVYEFKTRELFKRIGLENLLFDMHSPDYEKLLETASYLFENKEKIHSTLQQKIPALVGMASKNIEIIKNATH